MSQIGVYRSDDRCHFLVTAQESDQRKRLKGLLSVALPRAKPPLENPQARIVESAVRGFRLQCAIIESTYGDAAGDT